MDCLLRHTKNKVNVHRVAFAVLLIPVVLAIVLPVTTHAAAPVVDAAAQGPALNDLQNRVKRIENRLDNQGMVELMNRFEQLQREMQRIIGDLEVQNHQLKNLQKQQKDLYTDIDRRLRKLEQSPQAPQIPKTSGIPVAPATVTGSVSTSPVPVQPAGNLQAVPSQGNATVGAAPAQPVQNQAAMSDVERNVARSAYERAFNLLKQKRYDMAITSFKAFLETYPYASYADNAQYWLGEANYANKKYKIALSEFQKVINTYPNSPKRADAMLKIGYTYAELGDKKQAMDTLNTIVSSYPGSTAAKLAERRIKTLRGKR